MNLYYALVAFMAAERVTELAISERHVRALRARGAIEVPERWYPVMIAVHTLLLASCPLEVGLLHRPWLPLLGVPMLVLLGLAFALRCWVIAALGERWSTHVVCLPGARLVSVGPYRWMRHPNYLAVVIEFVALPLVHTAWLTAGTLSVANALVLRKRIRIEEEALARYCHD